MPNLDAKEVKLAGLCKRNRDHEKSRLHCRRLHRRSQCHDANSAIDRIQMNRRAALTQFAARLAWFLRTQQRERQLREKAPIQTTLILLSLRGRWYRKQDR